MTKEKREYHCNNCNYRPAKWLGCCPECQEWNTIQEHTVQPATYVKKAVAVPLVPLRDIKLSTHHRMLSGIQEWDRVLGGGIMPGSFTMVTGDPGIGKSTLLLQIAQRLAATHTVTYVSSEESLEQVAHRAHRLGCDQESLLFSDNPYLETIIQTAQEQKPHVLIIDSIQSCYVASGTLPGTIGQLREAAFHLMHVAKEQNIAIIITGHITKEGTLAGPKLLEHMVDTVLYLQGEERWHVRLLRAIKNRFGPIHEVGFFAMQEEGMKEVHDINSHLLSQATHAPGSALISSLEGSRPLLIELQALTLPTKFGMPQRVVSGIDPKQVMLMCALAEKYLRIKLTTYDIFFKVSGNLRLKESNTDLGILLALLSSYFQKALPEKSIALAEISLTGHLKPINQFSLHAQEASKFGIQSVFVANCQKTDILKSITIRKFNSIYDILSLFD